MRCTLYLALLGAIFVGVRARFVIEEGALKVVLPPEAKSQYPNGFDVALANFGEPCCLAVRVRWLCRKVLAALAAPQRCSA